jgi:hypothetical protein
VIDEHVGEAVGAQLGLQRGRRRVVLARMAYEKNRHAPLTPPYAVRPKLTALSNFYPARQPSSSLVNAL